MEVGTAVQRIMRVLKNDAQITGWSTENYRTLTVGSQLPLSLALQTN